MPTQKSDLDQWKAAARAIPDADIRVIPVPLHVLFGEAVDVARFFDRYWEDQKDKGGNLVRYGLCSAVPRSGNGSRARSKQTVATFSAKTGEEVLSLQRAGQEAQTAYLLAVDAKSGADPLARGRFLVGEIQATLEWLFDDGVIDTSDAQLESVVAAHADDPDTTDALASALDDFATLAAPRAKDMNGIGGFDSKYIAEAKALAAELRARPPQALTVTPAARSAIDLRNRVVSLLIDRMTLVRNAARFVFRANPEIVREATSAYERRRRAANRRPSAGTGGATPAAPSPVAAPAAAPVVTNGSGA